MKRLPILAFVLLVPAVLMLFGAAGCNTKKGGEGKTTDNAANKDGEKEKTKGKVTKTEIATAPEATVKGIVKVKGKVPEPKVIVDPKHQDAEKGLCGDKKDQLDRKWIIGKDDGVKDAIVILGPAADKKFKKLSEDLLKTYKHPVYLDQPYCNYIPHTVAVYAEYQPLIAKNTAKMNHNVKVSASAEMGGPRDFLVNPGKESPEMYFKGSSAPESFLDAACSIHTWMTGKVGVFNHPYFAVTDKDGHFEIKNVPIDEDITVYVWHASNPTKVQMLTQKMTKGVNELKTLEIEAK